MHTYRLSCDVPVVWLDDLTSLRFHESVLRAGTVLDHAPIAVIPDAGPRDTTVVIRVDRREGFVSRSRLEEALDS